MKEKIISISVGIIIFSNLLPIDKVFLDGSYYSYSNRDGSVTFTEIKARDFEMMKRKFEAYRQKTGNADTVMYKLFKRNPLTCWRWGKYFLSKRYKLPYKDWSEIEAIRGEIENKTGFQDF